MQNLIIENKIDALEDYTFLYEIYETILENEEHKKTKNIVNLLFVEDDEMKQYNFLYRKINDTTDVLSFEDSLEFSPVLGDIIINIEQAKRQMDTDLTTEIAVLFIHGMLHLLGYDHLNMNDEKKMKEKEKLYFSKIKEKI